MVFWVLEPGCSSLGTLEQKKVPVLRADIKRFLPWEDTRFVFVTMLSYRYLRQRILPTFPIIWDVDWELVWSFEVGTRRGSRYPESGCMIYSGWERDDPEILIHLYERLLPLLLVYSATLHLASCFILLSCILLLTPTLGA